MTSVIPPSGALRSFSPSASSSLCSEEPLGASVARRTGLRSPADATSGRAQSASAAAKGRRVRLLMRGPIYLFQEQLALARGEPARARLQDEVLQARLGQRVGVDRQRLADQLVELGLLLALDADALGQGHVRPRAQAARELDGAREVRARALLPAAPAAGPAGLVRDEQRVQGPVLEGLVELQRAVEQRLDDRLVGQQ